MSQDVALALAVAQQIRESANKLEPAAVRALEADLRRIERTLNGSDPYAHALDVLDLQQRLRQSSGATPDDGTRSLDGSPRQEAPAPAPPPAPAPLPPAQTSQIGQRAATALEAVDFVGFVSGLITGTFRAIVDASSAQMRDYAKLVASLAQTLEDFTAENVTPNQARDHLAQQFPQDLTLKLPPPGSPDQPVLLPRPERAGESPAWLSKYGLQGEELSPELVEGPLLESAQRKVGEGRLSSLASMVLMGVNRVVVNEGDVRAKLQFHAAAIDVQRAEFQQQGGTLVGRDAGAAGQTMQMMVSTLKANAQADAAIKADLMGEVRVSFRSEVFPLERFADSAAIQLINRHAKWGNPTAPAPASAPASGDASPSASAPAATTHLVTPQAPAAPRNGGGT
jgi:hypothetical protein